MSGEIRGTEPVVTIVDEAHQHVFTPEMVEKLLERESTWSSGVVVHSDHSHQAQQYQHQHVFPISQAGRDFWNNDPWIKAADYDVRHNSVDPGDQTHTHDATVATIPVDVARDLLQRFPDLSCLIVVHEAAEHAGELVDSIRDSGHLEVFANFEQVPTWVCIRCKDDTVEFVAARSGTRAHYACSSCGCVYAAPPHN